MRHAPAHPPGDCKLCDQLRALYAKEDAEHAPRLAVGTVEAMPVAGPAMTIGGVPVVVSDAVATVMMVMPMNPAEESPRFTPGTLVLVTLRWQEERGRGRPANELQQVRLGTIHGADNNAPRLSVEVPGHGVVVVERRDVEDAGVGCR